MEFDRWLAQLAGAASGQHWRYLLILSGDRDWGLGLCESSPLLRGEQSLWVSDHGPAACRSISPARASSLLGTETDHIVYDAWSGFHPNGFGILSGTVRAGGVLVLLAPVMAEWEQYDDPDYQRMAVPGYSCASRRFLQHLVRCLSDDADVILHRQGEALPVVPGLNDRHKSATLPVPVAGMDCITLDQAQAVAAIEHVVTGHRNRPLVLTADRGRGKSAALGIAAARLLTNEVDYIVVTAPVMSSVASVFKHAAMVLGDASREGNTLVWRGRRIQYIPPDELLRTRPPARLLLVDEAAAIPAPLLGNMLDHYHRVVFTTTVHGYEGTGRGFAVRFVGELNRRRPNWQKRQLVEPIRWAANDPLERIVRKMLWLDAEPAADKAIGDILAGELEIALIDRQQLLQQPALMTQLVGLLITAHYRTTPDDIRLLLDAPNMDLVLARKGMVVVAAILFAREGGLEPELIDAIRQGVRRPRGHLMPQTLWAQTGNHALLARTGWRIVRIAVHPAAQRRGIGLRLLACLHSIAAEQGVDYLGSSFGATTDLLAFWQRASYLPVAIGWRRDASSGTHGLLVLRAINPDLVTMIEQDRDRFAEVLPTMLVDQLQQLEADVLGALLVFIGCRSNGLQARDQQDVQDFVSGARGFEHCVAGLSAAAIDMLAQPQCSSRLSQQQREVLIGRILQRRGWAQLAQQAGLTGKAQVVQVLRAALQSLLPPGGPTDRS